MTLPQGASSLGGRDRWFCPAQPLPQGARAREKPVPLVRNAPLLLGWFLGRAAWCCPVLLAPLPFLTPALNQSLQLPRRVLTGREVESFCPLPQFSRIPPPLGLGWSWLLCWKMFTHRVPPIPMEPFSTLPRGLAGSEVPLWEWEG